MSIASHKLTIKRGENNFNDKAHKTAEYSFHGKVDKKKPTMVFIHGWPDNGDVWKNQTDHFSKTHNCVTITLPHYGRRDAPAAKRFPLGCSIDQLMELSRNAVVEVLKKTGDEVRVNSVGVGFSSQPLTRLTSLIARFAHAENHLDDP